MNLYVIFSEENAEVSIKKVDITKETEKQVSIKCDGISRKILTKAAIGTYLNEGHVYAYSADEALSIWNKHHTDKATELDKKAADTRALIKDTTASKLLK